MQRLVLIVDSKSKVIGQVGITGLLGRPLGDLTESSSERSRLRIAFSDCWENDHPQTITIWKDDAKREQYVVHFATLPKVDAVMVVVERHTRQADKGILTADELKLLTLLCDDKSPEQIWKALGVQRNTLRKRMSRLREKMGCHTTNGTVSRAIRQGIVD